MKPPTLAASDFDCTELPLSLLIVTSPMAAKLIEIEAVFMGERLRFENTDGDVIVGEARTGKGSEGDELDELFESNVIAIKGPADKEGNGALHRQLTYRFYGKWIDYTHPKTKKTEKQFVFQTFVRAQPHSRSGIIRYLCLAGTGNGIGQARAEALWDVFKSDAVRILRESPDIACAALEGRKLPLPLEKAAMAAAWLKEEADIEGCTIELMDLLTGKGFPKSTARKAVQTWGNQAAELIRRNPYLLMNFRNCGFKRTDALYIDLGLPPAKLKRQALSAWYAIASDSEGSTWHQASKAIAGIRANVGGVDLREIDALKLAKRAKLLSTIRTDGLGGRFVDQSGVLWVSETKKANNERYIADVLAASFFEDHHWPSIDDVDFSGMTEVDHQRDTLEQCLQGTIASLGGSPGTGKTRTAAALIQSLILLFGEHNICICAPTGKAAVRVTENLAAYGLKIRARTIHSTLGIASRADRGGWGFQHNEHNPLHYDFIIVDESSMIDADLMASLFRARKDGAHILFVGDINQLPPVGHGAPLRDMIAAGVPYGELRKIRRNSGAIVEACAAIRDGKRFIGVDKIDIDAGDNLKFLETSDPEKQIQTMLVSIEKAKGDGFNPVWDCQVLVPVNAKSKLSRKELNKILQEKLNPRPGNPKQPFRVGDKIVNTKNGFFPQVEAGSVSNADTDADEPSEDTTNDRGEVFVANGELAEVIDVQDKVITAKLSSPARTIKIPRGGNEGDETGSEGGGDDKAPATGCSWDLGYALSVHKSQGSEWPVVIVILDEYPGAKMVCSREWLYTAISRAKKLCLCVGKEETAIAYRKKSALAGRKTFTKELTVQGRVAMELELV